MATNSAELAVLAAALKSGGCKEVFVTAVGKEKQNFCVSVVTGRTQDRLYLATRRTPDKPRLFLNVEVALKHARQLTGLKKVTVEF